MLWHPTGNGTVTAGRSQEPSFLYRFQNFRFARSCHSVSASNLKIGEDINAVDEQIRIAERDVRSFIGE